MSTELSLAVVVADTVLYGLMIAYYVLTLNLNEQEKTRIAVQLGSTPKEGMTKEERDAVRLKADQQWMMVVARNASANMFLMGCTLFGVPGALLGVLALTGMEVLSLVAAVFFLLFLVVMALGMVGVAIQTIRWNASEFREKSGQPTKLMEIMMKGIGK